MRIEPIDSIDDSRLEFFRNLTDVTLRRRTEPKTGLYLAESVKIIERALLSGHQPVSAITLEKWLPSIEPLFRDRDVPVFVGETELLEALTGFEIHRGVIAAMERPALRSVDEVVGGARLIVVLEDIRDHTNVGAIFRSVAALGADAVLITPECADPYYRRSVRVSMGAVFHIPWTRIERWPEGIADLRVAGFTVVALALTDNSLSLADVTNGPHDRIAVVFGTEGHGLRARTIDEADVVARIPMSHGVDSLNVAAAAAVTLYALTHG